MECCERDEDWEEEDEADWDEATRMSLLGCKEGSFPKRSLCDSCGRPLQRVADLGLPACCFRCVRPDPCERCGEPILVGSLHFECPDEDVKICTRCGPGVVIERHYDYVNPLTGEKIIEPLPQRTQHKRKAGRLPGFFGCCGDQSKGTRAVLNPDAAQVLERVQDLCRSIAAEDEEYYDKDWHTDGDLLQTLFGTDAVNVVTRLARACAPILERQPTLNEVSAPCSVFGDIHGQLRDMLSLLNLYGAPWSSESRFLFNGDFVDRGAHQIEVLGVLFAMKICYPDTVFLNRGNHEDNVQNKKYGFSSACKQFGAAGETMLSAIWDCFNLLPLACCIGSRVLVVHGGIGNGLWDLEDLKSIKRPLPHDDLQENEMAYNILWSDPIAEDTSSIRGVFGVHQSPRGKIAKRFGWNVTQEFCERNNLDLIVRSHQALKDGYGFDVMHDEKLMRVFSARDYEGHRNDGCVLAITESESRDGENVLVVRAQVLRSLASRYR